MTKDNGQGQVWHEQYALAHGNPGLPTAPGQEPMFAVAIGLRGRSAEAAMREAARAIDELAAFGFACLFVDGRVKVGAAFPEALQP